MTDAVILSVSAETIYVIAAFALGVAVGVSLVHLWAVKGGRW